MRPATLRALHNSCLILSAGAALSACALQSGYREASTVTRQPSYSLPQEDSAAGSGGAASGTPVAAPIVAASPTPTPTSTGTHSSGTNAYLQLEVRGVGYVSQTFTVSTNRILRARFTPEQQDRMVAGTSVVPAYSQLAVYLGVGAYLQPTQMLSNGITRPSETSTVLDFSSSYTHQCSASDPSCRQQVSFTIARPNYDYACFSFGTYCPYTQVYSTHPWHGILEIATDDTVDM